MCFRIVLKKLFLLYKFFTILSIVFNIRICHAHCLFSHILNKSSFSKKGRGAFLCKITKVALFFLEKEGKAARAGRKILSLLRPFDRLLPSPRTSLALPNACARLEEKTAFECPSVGVVIAHAPSMHTIVTHSPVMCTRYNAFSRNPRRKTQT